MARLIQVLPLLALGGCWDSAIVTACEDLIKDRLKAPATYKRVSVRENKLVLTPRQWAGRSGSEHLEQNLLISVDMEAKGVKPAFFTVVIESDAANTFGTPIRGFNECKYLSDDGSRIDPSRIKLDGKTQLEWVQEALKAK